jgi:GAF domain-containing protein
VIGLAVPPEQGLAGYVFSTGQALAIADVASDTRFGRTYAEETDYLPRTIIAVPLQDADGTLGVLEVLDKRDGTPFTIGDVELATVFAAQATVAIRASRVERDTRDLLASALRSLAEDGDESLAEEIAERATAELVEDSGDLWALAEQVARLRKANPSSVRLVSEILGVVARQAERERSSGGRFRR